MPVLPSGPISLRGLLLKIFLPKFACKPLCAVAIPFVSIRVFRIFSDSCALQRLFVAVKIRHLQLNVYIERFPVLTLSFQFRGRLGR